MYFRGYNFMGKVNEIYRYSCMNANQGVLDLLKNLCFYLWIYKMLPFPFFTFKGLGYISFHHMKLKAGMYKVCYPLQKTNRKYSWARINEEFNFKIICTPGSNVDPVKQRGIWLIWIKAKQKMAQWVLNAHTGIKIAKF